MSTAYVSMPTRLHPSVLRLDVGLYDVATDSDLPGDGS